MTKEAYPKVYLYKRIVQAKLFMDHNFCDNIDVDNVAGEAFFSKFHFIRLFKSTYGKTPHQYLTCLRIEHAKHLLKNETAISEACFTIGFDSVSSFTGLFKRITGLTPSAWQLQQQKMKKDLTAVPLKFIPRCYAERKGWTKNSNFEEAGSA